MNNFAEKVTGFVPLLDAIMQHKAITAFLEIDPTQVQFIGKRFVKYPKINMDGMVTYDRVNGFSKAAVTLEWENHELTIDRAQGFGVDVMDDDELLFTAFANLMGEFLRSKVIPEIDAYRFSTFYGYARSVQDNTDAVIGVGTPEVPEFPENKEFDQVTLKDNVVAEAITAANSLAAWDEVEHYFGDEEIPMDMCVAFVSFAYHKFLKQSDDIERKIHVADFKVGSIFRKVNMLDNIPLIKVPVGRFKTVITLLNDLQGGETGFEWDVSAVNINFMVVHRPAVTCITKHAKLRYFAPDVNQDADQHLMQYRIFHDVISLERKRKGIYVSTVV